MLTGLLDELAHLGAPSPLVLLHVGNLLQLHFSAEDYVPLLSSIFLSRSGVSTMSG